MAEDDEADDVPQAPRERDAAVDREGDDEASELDEAAAEEAAGEDEPDDAEDPGEAAAADDDSVDEAAAGAAEASDDDADLPTSHDTKGAAVAARARPRKSGMARLWWALPVLMIVEFYVYGHNGRLQVCVGMQGETDFSLQGSERTDDNRWKFPRCEERLNLGLRSQEEEKVEEAIAVACRGATIFRHQGESKACKAGEDGWEHHVERHFVPPWDPAYYEHLFWFLQ